MPMCYSETNSDKLSRFTSGDSINSTFRPHKPTLLQAPVPEFQACYADFPRASSGKICCGLMAGGTNESVTALALLPRVERVARCPKALRVGRDLTVNTRF